MALILTHPSPPDIHPQSSYPFTSQECDDANEAELQGRVEALRRKAPVFWMFPEDGEMWPGEVVVKNGTFSSLEELFLGG